MAAYELIDHEYDVVVVGAGGSGLRAALGAAQQGLKILAVMANTFFAIAVGAACAFALLKISFGG